MSVMKTYETFFSRKMLSVFDQILHGYNCFFLISALVKNDINRTATPQCLRGLKLNCELWATLKLNCELLATLKLNCQLWPTLKLNCELWPTLKLNCGLH